MPPTPGLRAHIDLVVTDRDTAIALGSGDVPVLATPRILALCEEATVAAVAPVLESDETTVGIRAELDHTAPTAVGATVVATAELTAVEGRTLTFAVHATAGGRIVASGSVRRVVVDRQRFVDRLA